MESIIEKNIRQLMREKGIGSIGKLRDSMAEAGYAIGNSTIQRALEGGTGNRLASLEKIAAFFDVTTEQLLQPEMGRGDAPAGTAPSPKSTTVPPEFIQLIEDLKWLAKSQRSIFMDQIHQAAELARETIAEHNKAESRKVAAARKGSSGRHTATVSWGDGNRRQKSLPLSTVSDPFTAAPSDSELNFYRRIEGEPKMHGGDEE